ncbi:hypothetical protein DFH94DRAFT_707145 [Russula ochroleuca]|uniref:Uncharacterized protein n=1 Tax=Russula ochroleuca TaxID=152965 RepID=A0A9P5N3U0_9AGAM|nr:hypothetical protein DFH94DRAFT_707145 [Russula ochroleuca]
MCLMTRAWVSDRTGTIQVRSRWALLTLWMGAVWLTLTSPIRVLSCLAANSNGCPDAQGREAERSSGYPSRYPS